VTAESPTVGPPADLAQRAEALGRTLLAEAGDEVGRADQKASILLATASVAAAAIAGGLYGSNWSTDLLSNVGRVIWWAGWILVGLGILSLVAAVYPRQARDDDTEAPHLCYFDDAGRMKDAAELEAALNQAVITGDRGTAHQLLRVARIVRRKYALIRAACWSLVIGTVALLVGPGIRL
jgi:hypothetical protein